MKKHTQTDAAEHVAAVTGAVADEATTMTRLRAHLAFLGLTNLLDALPELISWSEHERPGHMAFLERALGAEVDKKSTARVDRRVRSSGLVEHKTLEGFDWLFQPKLDKSFFLDLAPLDFVHRREDLIFTGMTGTGKSHILKALGLRACIAGVPIRYARAVDLLDDLHAGLADGTYDQRLKAWARPALLIIDDVGLGQVRKRDDEPTAAHTLYNIIDRRHGRASTAVSSNIDLREWGRYLGDATVAAAILDRLAMHAIRVDFDGPSYRQHVAAERAKKSKTTKKPAKA